jgi:hypothetical protein
MNRIRCCIALTLSYTVAADLFLLMNLSPPIPSPEALVTGIVACEMAMPHEVSLEMATRKGDLFVKAHFPMSRRYDSSSSVVYRSFYHCQLAGYGGTMQTYIKKTVLWSVLEI